MLRSALNTRKLALHFCDHFPRYAPHCASSRRPPAPPVLALASLSCSAAAGCAGCLCCAGAGEATSRPPRSRRTFLPPCLLAPGGAHTYLAPAACRCDSEQSTEVVVSAVSTIIPTTVSRHLRPPGVVAACPERGRARCSRHLPHLASASVLVIASCVLVIASRITKILYSRDGESSIRDDFFLDAR